MFNNNCFDCCSCSDDRGSPGENLHPSNRSGQPDEWPNNCKCLFSPESKWTTALTLLCFTCHQTARHPIPCLHSWHSVSLSLGFYLWLTEGKVLDDGAFCDCAILAKECPEFFLICLLGHISHKNIFIIVKYLIKNVYRQKGEKKIGHLETGLT